MTESVKSISNLPDWFYLNNYLNQSYSNKELWVQLYCRWLVLDNISQHGKAIDEYQIYWEEIQSKGQVISNNYKEITKYKNLNDMKGGSNVQPLCLMDVWVMGTEARKVLAIEENTDKTMMKIQRPEDRWKSYDLACGHKDTMSLIINLGGSDTQILKELEALLPFYRQKLSVENPDFGFIQSDIKRVINYRILPLLDLHIWEKTDNKKITNRVLSTVLFPDGTKGDDDIRKTIRPFMKKIIESPFLFEWESYF